MKRKPEHQSSLMRGRLLGRSTLAAAAASQLFVMHHALAASYSFSSSGGSAWLSTNNWQSSTIPGPNDVALFDVDPTAKTASSGVGLNFSQPAGSFNTGTAGNEAVGAIEVDSNRTNGLFIGSTANGTSGSLTLNGATINGQSNTILANFDSGGNSTGNLTITNFVQSNTSSFLGLALAKSANSVLLAAGTTGTTGTTGALGDVIDIVSNISQISPGASITVLGGGNATINGGVLQLAGTNSFTGGITVGDTAGTAQAAVLEIDSPSALPTTGSETVNANSVLLFDNTSGTTTSYSYGGTTQSLTLNGNGNPKDSGALRVDSSGSGAVNATWNGIITLGSSSTFSITTGNTLSLPNEITDNSNGFQLLKQGGGTLAISATNNVLAGGTSIGNGIITVASGSSIGTGALAMASTSTNSTGLILNNAAQTIGDLSSSFAASGGTETQIITLNGTALTINESGTSLYGNGSVATLASSIVGTGSVTLYGGGNATTGGGTLELSGSSGFTGGITVGDTAGTTQAAVLQVDSGAALPTSGNVTINQNSVLIINTGTTTTYGGATQTLSLNGIGAKGYAGALRILGSAPSTYQGTISLAGNTTIDVAAAASSLILSGPVVDNGNTFTKLGQAALTFASGSNILTGSTVVAGGTLIVDSNSAIASGSLALAESSSTATSTSLILNNAAQSIGNLSTSFVATSGTAAQTLTLNGTALTINESGTSIFGNGNTSTLASSIVGSGSITLDGGGNASSAGGLLELAGSSGFTGGITVGDTTGTNQAAILQVDLASALPTAGAIVINPNSSLVFNALGAANFGGTLQTLTISGNGAPGTLGVLRTASVETAAIAGTVNLATASQIDTASHLSTLTLAGPVVDNGFTLTKSGLGTLVFASASNSFSGNLSISDGTLIVSSGSSMESGPLSISCPAGTSTSTGMTSVFLNNTAQTIGSLSDSFSNSAYPQAVTLNLNGTALTINQTTAGVFGNGTASYVTGAITGIGSVTLSSNSTAALQLSGTNTYTGTTTVNGGTLQTLAGGAIAGGGAINVNAGLLQVNANSSISGTGQITVSAGSFGGGGSVAGPVTFNGGTAFEGGLANAVGTFSAGNNFLLTNAATLKIKLQGPNSTAGTLGDQIALTGTNDTFTVGGAALQVVAVTGSTFSTAAFPITYKIVDATGAGDAVDASNFFAGLTPGQQYTDVSGDTYSVSVANNNEIDLTLYGVSASAVPEPASLSLFGLAGALLLRRKRRSGKAMDR